MNGHDQKFRSRKFILTNIVTFGALALCAAGKMEGGAASAVLLACVASYNWANVKAAG